jgi:hypothetical protein
VTETPETRFASVTVTCHTEGCGNAEQPITFDIPEGGAVACGVCGEPITDIAT